MKPVQRFISSAQGTVAVVFSVAAVALVLVAGLGVDYVSLVGERAELQAAADASAVAGAKEISLANSDPAQITIVAENFARANLGLSTQGSDASKSGGSTDSSTSTSSSNMLSASSSDSGDSADSGSGGGGDGVTVTTTLDDSTSTISVEIEKTWTPYFAGIFSAGQSTIRAAASAQLVGTGKTCVVGLDETQGKTVHLRRDAVLTANRCGVYSNATNSRSIQVDDNGTLSASLICSAGGTYGKSSSYTPAPTTDCPVLPDPLAERLPPSVGPCEFTNFEAIGPNVTVSPGVYCGGLVASSSTVVTFQPGTYVIKDGPLEAQSSATFQGENVGFYLIGINTEIRFSANTKISLTAPEVGDMAGLLFFEDRSNSTESTHRITSNNARLLLGTIYLPRGTLYIDANAPVADQSAYTAIVTRKLALDAGPNLILNSDYNATDIPAPSGLSGVGGRVVLTK